MSQDLYGHRQQAGRRRRPRLCAPSGRRRRGRSCGAALPRILRRPDPQHEHPHGQLPGRATSSGGSSSTEIGELADIEPVHVAAYIEALQETASSLRSSSAWDPDAVRPADH